MSDSHLNPHHAHSDSAGVPWEGRDLADHPFTGDDGSQDPALAAVLTPGTPPDPVAVVAALRDTRLLVPVVSMLDQETEEKSAEMAMVSLTMPDGRRAMPAFTHVSAMAAWDPQARPVPSEARRAAIAAVDEGCDLLVLDLAGPVPMVVPRPALWALAQDRPWVPSHSDPEVAAALAHALDGITGLVGTSCEPGGPGAELRLVLQLVPGLTREQVQDITAEVSRRVATLEVVAERVDSLQLSLRG